VIWLCGDDEEKDFDVRPSMLDGTDIIEITCRIRLAQIADLLDLASACGS